MEGEKHNVAIITIPERAILDWLQFEGGKVCSIHFSADKFAEVELMIEHPDLPEMNTGDMLLHIRPIYEVTVDDQGNTILIKRVDPPKKESE